MKQLTLAIKFTATADNKAEFKQILNDLFSTISDETNFVNATLHEGYPDTHEFLVYETWNDTLENFLAVQMKKPYAAAFEEKLLHLDVKREPAAYAPFAYFGNHLQK